MQIKPNLYSVGVINPTLRVFDIVMRTEFGTTYNAYLLKNDEGSVLIDTVHNSFQKQYFENIKKYEDIKNIKYLVVNHTEPDHSGAVAKLIELNPNIEIYCSFASSNFLKQITNLPNLKFHIIKDKEELKIGNITLVFYSAPLLHWPDSIFTLYKEESILFTCDFLGCHYGNNFDYDINIKPDDIKNYEHEVKNYYDGIFSPFTNAVKKGIEIIESLKPDMICTSHGPILTKDGYIGANIEKYKIWSNVKLDDKFLPVFYVSAYGNTKKMAETIKAAAIKKGYKSEIYNVIDHPVEQLAAIINSVSKFAIGSPTLNHNALPPIWNLLGYIDATNVANKQVLVFGSYGWTGEANNLLTNYFTSLRLKVSDQSFKINFVPTKQDLEQIEKNIDIFLN